MGNIWRCYLLPGFIFQAIIIAGGYGTGRELVEFFLQLGPKAGLLSLVVAGVVWSIVCACTFLLAQHFHAYDYRSFFQRLLGKYWWLFEISYILIITLVLAIVAASAGSVLQQTFGFTYSWGVAGLLFYVALIIYKGSQTVEWVLSGLAAALYFIYGLLFFFGFQYFGEQISAVWQNDVLTHDSWLINGIRYAGYNLGLIPAVLFCLTHLKTRRQAITSGLLTGVLAILPAFLFYIIMLGEYPQIIQETVPSLYILSKMKIMWLEIAFTVVLLGTLVDTATGLLHAFNERVEMQLREMKKTMPNWARSTLAIAFLIGSLLLAQFGLIDLISQGYGWLTWLIIFVYVVPVLYKGIPELFRSSKKTGITPLRNIT